MEFTFEISDELLQKEVKTAVAKVTSHLIAETAEKVVRKVFKEKEEEFEKVVNDLITKNKEPFDEAIAVKVTEVFARILREYRDGD